MTSGVLTTVLCHDVHGDLPDHPSYRRRLSKSVTLWPIISNPMGDSVPAARTPPLHDLGTGVKDLTMNPKAKPKVM